MIHFFFLYFIRFEQGRSQLVQVKRPIQSLVKDPSAALTVQMILDALQAGPLGVERHLINPMNKRVRITSIRSQGGLLRIQTDASIHSQGKQVIQDRLDQLTFTLTQFSQWHAIQLSIDNPAVDQQGSLVSGQMLQRNQRRVIKYNDPKRPGAN